MSVLVRSIIAATALLLSPGCTTEPRPAPPVVDAAAAPEGFTLPEGFDDQYRTYIHGWGQYWPTFRVHGTTAVFAEGAPLYLQSWGLRDLAQQAPHTPSDTFEIGTLSVHLTVAATLALVREGSVQLDDPVAKHLPDAELAHAITIEHLLTMTSGLHNFTETLLFERIYKRNPVPHASLVASLAGQSLEFEPGSDFAPSLSNTAVLGLLIERVTEQPYADAVRASVLVPLGMKDTHYGRVEGASVGLSFNEDEYLEPVVEADPRSMGAAGGWSSTPADLGRLYAAMLQGHFGTELTRRALGDNDLQRAYGFAATTVGGRDALAWVGRFDGHEHGVVLVPEDGLVVLHLANSEVAPGSEIAQAAAELAYEVAVPVREEARAVPVDARALAPFAGTWALRPSDLRLVEETVDDDTARALASVQTQFAPEDGLRLLIDGRPLKRMHPTGPRTFFFKDRPQSTAYLTTTSGRPSLVLERDGGALHYGWVESPGT